MASKIPPSDVLAAWLARQRWFAAKTRRIEAIVIEDAVPLAGAVIAVARVTLDDGGSDRYAVPLGASPAGGDVADALDDPHFCRALLDLIARGAGSAGKRGEVRGGPTSAFPPGLGPDLPVRRLGGEQSNTSVTFGDAVIVKHFRRLAEGINPEAEMTRFLTERARFAQTPRLFGQLDYRRDGATTTLAVAQELVAGARDGWQWMLAALGDFYALARRASGPPDAAQVRALAGVSLGALDRLGAVTAALHRALASDPRDADFAPEPITPGDLAAWSGDVGAQLEAAREALGREGLVADLDVRAALNGLRGSQKIRHHGDLHLGQTLYRDGDFAIIDFEGEPIRPLAERRRKHTPLRDVAGLLRSIDYVAQASRPAGLEAWVAAWQAEAARALGAAYRAGVRGAPFAPERDEAFARAVAVFELEKAAYEIVYEANHRPDWVEIPTRGLLRAAACLGPSPAPGAA